MKIFGKTAMHRTAVSRRGNSSSGVGAILLRLILVLAGLILSVFRAYVLTPARGLPDLLLVYLLLVAVFWDSRWAAITAVIAGYAADALAGGPACVLCIFYTLAALLPDLLDRGSKTVRYRLYFIFCGIFSVGEIVPMVCGKILGGVFSVSVFSCIWQTALCGAVLGSIVILLTAAGQRINREVKK